MNLRMAIQTGSAKQETIVEAVVSCLTGQSNAGMACRRMALLAQQGGPPDQQGWVVAAVWPVAQRAVLRCRCMLPQKRPALFCMAGIAGQVDG